MCLLSGAQELTLIVPCPPNNLTNVFGFPPVAGIILSSTFLLDDGPEYSPCGEYIWFNSVRTGLMQVWRMKKDGSEQTQMTKRTADPVTQESTRYTFLGSCKRSS